MLESSGCILDSLADIATQVTADAQELDRLRRAVLAMKPGPLIKDLEALGIFYVVSRCRWEVKGPDGGMYPAKSLAAAVAVRTGQIEASNANNCSLCNGGGIKSDPDGPNPCPECSGDNDRFNSSDTGAITEYVMGLMFDGRFENVALIRKNRPDWQRGLLNGIGGHVEPGESFNAAMVREFQEESGVGTICAEWTPFCRLQGINNDQSGFAVQCYFALGDLNRLSSQTDEQISLVRVRHVLSGGPFLVGNVPWLTSLAIDVASSGHPPKEVTVVY